MAAKEPGDTVLVQVLPLGGGREIGWGASTVTALSPRLHELGEAIAAGSRAVAQNLARLSAAPGWELTEVSASFGITLTAESGVIIAKGSAGAAIEVNVIFRRESVTS